MKFKNKIFAILAVFCVILSACAVSAADDGILSMTDGDMYDPGVPYHADGTDPTLSAGNNSTDGDMYDPGVPYHADGTDPTGNATDGDMYDPGVPYHADGTDPTQTPIGNETGNATGNATQHAAGGEHTTTHTMPATGNPILVLLAIGAVLGGATLMTRKK
ncbi:hypothetical protein [Methanobrevibacter sp.]|uniref:hypothetical protein n=1 Tax=Methanobrevibacter sp. TaxID=66852 RepID=UPI003891144E